MSTEHLTMQTKNIADENFQKLAQLFPNAITETKDSEGNVVRAIDKDVLMQEISATVVEGNDERYQFTWPDKRKAIISANTPTSNTLRPCREESVDFDKTQNLYIEGDNLEVLKCLRETYLGKVKMIYIDPPYNTGKDFVYKDDFNIDTEEWKKHSGDYDVEGNKLVLNTDNNGRFHTDWLNMIYPRLKVAKDLLCEDGVIFISIDDNEVENLKKLCDEVFGADNYVNIISANVKNIAGASGGGEDKRLKKNCEYCLIYSRNYQSLKTFTGIYAYTEIYEIIKRYREEGKTWHYNSVLINPGEKVYVASTVDGEGNEIKIFKRLNTIIKSVNQIIAEEKITEKEVFYKYGACIFEAKDAQSSIRNRVIDAKLKYEITEDIVSIEYIPRTGKNKGKIYEQFYKGDKCRLFAWLRDISEYVDGVLYKKDAQGTYWDLTQFINNLTKEGDIVFQNGKKPVELIKRMLIMVTEPDSIVLDFFSGSATTAHAVMQLNAEDGGKRKFIMVQLPEATDEKSDDYKAGYKNICEIGKERIRRAGKKIKDDLQHYIEEQQSKIAILSSKLAEKSKQKTLDLGTDNDEISTNIASLQMELEQKQNILTHLDTGFRVLKLDSSNMEDVYYTPAEYLTKTGTEKAMFNVKVGRTSEDLLFQVMLELGIELTSKIELEKIGGKEIFKVEDNFLVACFDEAVDNKTIEAIAKLKPTFFAMKDASAKDDSTMTNIDQYFKQYSPETNIRII